MIANRPPLVTTLIWQVTAQWSPYPLLKAPPLGGHNLIVSLDHDATCDGVNIGFIYAQHCAAGGRVQWVFEEALRREEAMCAPRAEALYGDNGSFWKESDGALITRGPHRLRAWSSARDQKVPYMEG